MIAQCQNCAMQIEESKLQPIKNIFQRVAPGELMPAGECPHCGCLAHRQLSSEMRGLLLKRMVTDGLTIGECTQVLAAPDDDPFVQVARAITSSDEDIDLDDAVVVASAEQGSHVLAWLWISNEEALVADEDTETAERLGN